MSEKLCQIGAYFRSTCAEQRCVRVCQVAQRPRPVKTYVCSNVRPIDSHLGTFKKPLSSPDWPFGILNNASFQEFYFYYNYGARPPFQGQHLLR